MTVRLPSGQFTASAAPVRVMETRGVLLPAITERHNSECTIVSLPGFQQHVNCNTRKTKTLDKCYGNISNAYTVKIKPPLANSAHDTVQLIPVNRTLLKSCKSVNKVV